MTSFYVFMSCKVADCMFISFWQLQRRHPSHAFFHQIALKMADLGHLCDPTPVHLQWVQRLEEEFFMQGDAEQAAGMPITPLFDRTKPGVTKSQVAFMDIVALPLYKAMAQFCSDTEPFLEGVSEGCFALLVLLQ
jgi:hypothetical protein